MTTITRNTSTPAPDRSAEPTTERRVTDGQTEVTTSGGPDNATVTVDHALGESTNLSARVDADAEGLRRAHVELERFTAGGHRLSAKVGTSALSEETAGGAVMTKLQLDSRDWRLAGPLSHNLTAKVGAFHFPRSRAVRNGLDEDMTLVGVGLKYGLQLDTSIGGERGVDVTGRYGVSADIFIEPNPSDEARTAFSRGMNFSAFDLGKTTGFSELSVSASTRAAYGVSDKVEVGVTHNLEYELDDPTIGHVVNDHSVSADVSVLSLFGRDQVDLHAGVRVPLEDRTPRPGYAPDGVTTGLGVDVRPTEDLTLRADAALRDGSFAGAGVRVDYQVNDRVALGGGYQYDSFSNEHRGYAGLSVSFGGGGRQPARRARSAEYLRRHTDPIERSDRARHFGARPASRRVSAGEVEGFPTGLEGMTYDEALDAIDTPDKAAALLGSGTYFEYGFHDENVKFSPRSSWARRTGVVCAEQHSVQAQALKRNGYQAHNVEYFANGVGHVVTVYQDKQTGKWNVLDYNNKYETQAGSIKEAMEQYEPGYYEYKVIDYSDTDAETERPRVVEVHRAAVVREVRAFWNEP